MEAKRWLVYIYIIAALSLSVALMACSGGGGGGVDINFTLDSFIVVYDLNCDGLDDIVVTKIHIFDKPPHPGYVAVLLQDPDVPGNFLPVTEYPVGSDPSFVTISDINNDSFPDLIATNSNSDSVSILLQDHNNPGNFINGITIPTGIYPNSVAGFDLNNDGYKDLAVCCGHSLVYLYFQDPANSLSFLTTKNISIPPGGNCANITVADIDNNGLPDLVIASTGVFSENILSSSGGSIYIFLQDELLPGSFLPAYSYPVGDTIQPTFVESNDLNNDGLLDLAIVNLGTPTDGSSAGVSIMIQDPNNLGAFLKPKYYATGVRSQAIAISDLNADGLLDLAVSNSGALTTDCDWLDNCIYDVNGSISILFNTPDDPGNFLPAHNIVGPDQYLGVGIGHLNGDLRPDIAIAAKGIPVLFQNPATPGEFFSSTYVETGSQLP